MLGQALGPVPLVRWSMNRTWFVWMSAFSFIIYALHTPLLAYVINPALSLGAGIPGFQLLTFFWLPVTVIIFCILTGALLRAVAPKVYGLLTGGRGM